MSLYASAASSPMETVSLRKALESLDPPGRERRRARRSTFCYRLLLTSLDDPEAAGVPLCVAGRDFSARGVGFEHPEQLPYRRVRLSAADPVLDELGFADLEIDLLLKWCRFISPGVYESGGRVTRTTAPLF